ncbi:helix-turn-helix domain-containing protein [Cupriavidus necator]|uniref:helix-turn-helix domain-containing protein n=1 Tax=Cupriavidus necator TaxID=106590 RepID=UPI003AF3978A
MFRPPRELATSAKQLGSWHRRLATWIRTDFAAQFLAPSVVEGRPGFANILSFRYLRIPASPLCGTPTRPNQDLDPRLSRALDYIRSNVRNPLLLSDVASAVAQSESRFRHLFVAGTGSSFRAYLLWLRINLAIEAVMSGASWTEAAHEAGFADSAHLTRTHKRMFGIEPTALRPQPLG